MESWSYHRYLRGLWHAWLPPPGAVGARMFGSLWQPVAACGSLCRRMAACASGLQPIGCRRHRCLEARGFDARMRRWLAGWLGWLTGWLGWLARLAGWLAGWLASWLAALLGGERISENQRA